MTTPDLLNNKSRDIRDIILRCASNEKKIAIADR